MVDDIEDRPVEAPPAPPSRLRRRVRAAVAILAGLLLLPVPMLLAYRFLPPLGTPLMLLRRLDGIGIDYRWTPLDRIAPALPRAVVASEDGHFCVHHGFDWGAIREAVETAEAGGRLRGASTLSQQTAKNLFLWPGQSWLRKGVEAYLTVLLEALWPKRRIAEVYLNIAEWGAGIYGAEAAAQHDFGVPAARLSPAQAAALAVVLPSPRHWSAARPGPYVQHRAMLIWERALAAPAEVACLGELRPN